MPELIVIADDLTGALDTGATFAQKGAFTLAQLRHGSHQPDYHPLSPACDVLVISTESRNLQGEQATRTVETVAHSLVPVAKSTLVYKKIDSTLRGHPGVELAAVMRTLQIGGVLVAPAFPAQGRTTRDGIQRVNGLPLEQSAFAYTVSTSDVLALFSQTIINHPTVRITLADIRRGADHVCSLIGNAADGVYVADAETDSDLNVLAQVALRCRLRVCCGSAGLANALAGCIYAGVRLVNSISLPLASGPALVVVGSRNPVSLQQVEAAVMCGIPIINLEPDFARRGSSNSSMSRLVMQICEDIARNHSVIVTTADLDTYPNGESLIAKRLGEVVAEMLGQVRIATLVLTGGDTAAAVCAALGAELLQISGALQPGIAVSRVIDGSHRGLILVTKAGGFGDRDALRLVITMVNAREL